MRKLFILFAAFISIISFESSAEIPFEQLKGIYDATKEGQKESSPLWGFVALKSNFLKNIRFHGNYGSYEQGKGLDLKEQTMQLALAIGLSLGKGKWEALKNKDIPQDPIAALIQMLFRSPDGEVFIPTDAQYTGVVSLAKVFTNAGSKISLIKMNDVFLLIEKYKGDKQTKKEEFKKSIYRVFNDKKLSHELKNELELMVNPEKFNAIKRIQKQKFLELYFAHILGEALEYESLLKEESSLYPKNIVRIALMAYAWKMAESKEDLKVLTALMDSNKLDIKEVYSAKDYCDPNVKEKCVLDQQKLKALKEDTQKFTEEEIAFLAEGYSAYEELIPTPFESKSELSDCGETSLRNFFYMVFSKDGSFDFERFQEFILKMKGDINTGKAHEIINYFKRYPTRSVGQTHSAHTEWYSLVSYLNDIKHAKFCNVFYRKGGYEIGSQNGLINTLNIFAKLLPENENLAEKWLDEDESKKTQIIKKFDCLCNLISSQGRKFDWNIDKGRIIQSLEPPYTLSFSFNDRPAFEWRFYGTPEHLYIEKLNRTSSWREKIKGSSFSHPLFQAWFSNEIDKQNLVYPYIIYGQHLGSLEVVLKACEYIFSKKYGDFYPLAVNWLTYFDEIDKIHNMFSKFPDMVDFIIEKKNPYLNNKLFMLSFLLRENKIEPAKNLIETGNVQIFGLNEEKNGPLHIAAKSPNENMREIIKLLIEKGAEVSGQTKFGPTPLEIALICGNELSAEILFKSGAKLGKKYYEGKYTQKYLDRFKDSVLKIINQKQSVILLEILKNL